MKAKFFLLPVAVLAMSLTALSQQTNAWSHFMWGGIKRNIFSNGTMHISAFNPTPNYDIKNIEPKVHSTMSFALGLKSYKPMGKRWTFSNTVGLDMQQLSVETGIKKFFSNGTSTSYTSFEIQQLIPRLKLAAGLDYSLLQKENKALSLGLSGGQMLRLNKEGYSYSFLESNLSYTRKQYKLFLSGSFSPYDVTIPGSEAFFGNLDAESISANVSYRIVDITAGIAISLR